MSAELPLGIRCRCPGPASGDVPSQMFCRWMAARRLPC